MPFLGTRIPETEQIPWRVADSPQMLASSFAGANGLHWVGRTGRALFASQLVLILGSLSALTLLSVSTKTLLVILPAQNTVGLYLPCSGATRI